MKRRLLTSKATILRRPCSHRFNSSCARDATDPISTPPASPSTNVDSPSVKPRKWGNRPLPLSPIMDAMRIEQRARHRKTKLPPPKNADLTPFQKALVNNPYARALATDIRQCKITDAHLPSFFQIPFELLPSPDPRQKIHAVPTRLIADVSPKFTYRKTGASSYVQGRQSILKHIQTAKRPGEFVRHATRKASNVGIAEWRQDMDEFVLRLLQSAVVRSLRWGLQHPKAGLVARCDDGAGGVESIDGVACLIYLETIKSDHSTIEAKMDRNIDIVQSLRAKVEDIERDIRKHNNIETFRLRRKPPEMSIAARRPPARYPSAPYRDHIIPVYSLMDLIGEEKMVELVKDTVFDDARAIVVKEGNLTTNAQMALLRLQEYMN